MVFMATSKNDMTCHNMVNSWIQWGSTLVKKNVYNPVHICEFLYVVYTCTYLKNVYHFPFPPNIPPSFLSTNISFSPECGPRVLSLMSQYPCKLAGGNEPRLIAAAAKQLNTLPFYHSFWNRTTKPSLV